MTAILYPVAADAGQAFNTPRGRAAREREAAQAAGEPVAFVTEPVGPAYATREAALDALAGRVEDERPGRPAIAAEDRVVSLVEQVAPQRGRSRAPGPVAPSFEDGHRWPAAAQAPATVWRAMISYWRIGPPPVRRIGGEVQARQARRKRGEEIDRDALRALTRQPLMAVKPQQPLDIGLFETRLPEAPHIVVPDE